MLDAFSIHYSVAFAGLLCTTFYHFFVHDKTGPIGNLLRQAIPSSVRLGLTDETFAAAIVSLFMQITGFLQMPIFLGPNFSPFTAVGSFIERQLLIQQSPKPTEPESKPKNPRGRPKKKEKNT